MSADQHPHALETGSADTGGPRVALAYVADRAYHQMTLFALASVGLQHQGALDIYLFQDRYEQDVPAAYRAAIERCGHSLNICPAPDYAPAASIGTFNHISSTTFCRVAAIEQLAARHDYIVYLDGDTLAFGDLNLEKICSFEEDVAACLDLSVSTGFDDPEFFGNCRRNGVSPKFFNAGVLLVKSAAWTGHDRLAEFTRNLVKHAAGCDYFHRCKPNDQCVLNRTFNGSFKCLPVEYNVQKSAMQTRAWSSALVRHYTGAKKFMPIRAWTSDRREHGLLRLICESTGLGAPPGRFDSGLTYAVNAMRRRKTIRKYEQAIALIRAAALDAPMEKAGG